MKQILANAIAFAAEKHKNQYDKAGKPYILHPIAVMQYLETDDQELMAIAVLHDVVEDCKVTYEDLRNIGMSERIIEGVTGMTKVPGETMEDNLKRMTTNWDVVKVKLCDLRHNMDPRRLKGITEKDRERMDKYVRIYHHLKAILDQRTEVSSA